MKITQIAPKQSFNLLILRHHLLHTAALNNTYNQLATRVATLAT